MKDNRRLKGSLLAAAGGFILGGLATKDKYAALNMGFSGLDGALQEFGRTNWAVLLGKTIAVVPTDETTSEGEWVAWEVLA